MTAPTPLTPEQEREAQAIAVQVLGWHAADYGRYWREHGGAIEAAGALVTNAGVSSHEVTERAVAIVTKTAAVADRMALHAQQRTRR